MKRLDIRPEQEDNSFTRHMKLINLDKLFINSPNARIINNESLMSRSLSADFIKSIYSNTDGDLGFVPSCECGRTHGVAKVGSVCPDCNTVCSSVFVDKLEHVSWLDIPEEMGPVLHPVWYEVLAQLTSMKVNKIKVSLLDFILNPELEKNRKQKIFMPENFEPFVIGRGFKAFYENVDYYLDVWLYKYETTVKKTALVKDIIKLREMYGDCMFTRKLPILHNSLHPITDNGATLKYIDSSSKNILAAAINLSVEKFKLHSTRKRNHHVDKALFDIYKTVLDYYNSLITTKIQSKKGILRKHIFGSRIHYGFRTVVHPHNVAMPMDEIVLPWGIMVNSLKLILLNFLVNRYHKTVDEAMTLFYHALTNYDPLIDKCLREYIDETPKGKIPIALGRNPTLNYGSIMLLYVRNYKTEPEDETMAINACIVGPANIDFDGDELYGFFIFEEELAESLSAAHPSQFLFSIKDPGLSDSVGLINQLWICFENYAEEDPDIEYYEELS